MWWWGISTSKSNGSMDFRSLEWTSGTEMTLSLTFARERAESVLVSRTFGSPVDSSEGENMWRIVWFSWPTISPISITAFEYWTIETVLVIESKDISRRWTRPSRIWGLWRRNCLKNSPYVSETFRYTTTNISKIWKKGEGDTMYLYISYLRLTNVNRAECSTSILRDIECRLRDIAPTLLRDSSSLGGWAHILSLCYSLSSSRLFRWLRLTRLFLRYWAQILLLPLAAFGVFGSIEPPPVHQNHSKALSMILKPWDFGSLFSIPCAKGFLTYHHTAQHIPAPGLIATI